MIVIEKLNEVYLQINCEKSIAYEIKDLFSCFASNYKFHPKFKARIWDGRISMFNYRENLLPIGLLQPLLKYFDDNNYKYSLNFKLSELINDTLTPKMTHEFLQRIFSNTDKPPRDYQEESVHSCLVNKKGVIESPTGSGKSLIIYSIIRALLEADNKILLIVPNISLVNQMYSDFGEYGWTECESYVDILYSGKKLTGKPILVSTYQSLVNKSEQFLEQFNGILIDECHGVKDASKSLKSIIHKCQNAEYRFGFTGTLPEEDIDVLTINSYLGDVLFNQTTGELIDQGILSQIEIVNLLYKYAPPIVEKNKNRSYPEEERFIEGFEHRNKIFNYIFDNVSDGENTLILCRHIEHLKKIEQYLLDNLDDKYKVLVIYGEVKPEVREHIRKTLDEDDKIKIYLNKTNFVLLNKSDEVFLENGLKKQAKDLTLNDDISDSWILDQRIFTE
jgi:superfamily II DNA or RNA helicase